MNPASKFAKFLANWFWKDFIWGNISNALWASIISLISFFVTYKISVPVDQKTVGSIQNAFTYLDIIPFIFTVFSGAVLFSKAIQWVVNHFANWVSKNLFGGG